MAQSARLNESPELNWSGPVSSWIIMEEQR
jgi:hypothetical protein